MLSPCVTRPLHCTYLQTEAWRSLQQRMEHLGIELLSNGMLSGSVATVLAIVALFFAIRWVVKPRGCGPHSHQVGG